MTGSRNGLRIAVVAYGTGIGTLTIGLAARFFGYRKGVAVFACCGNCLGLGIVTTRAGIDVFPSEPQVASVLSVRT